MFIGRFVILLRRRIQRSLVLQIALVGAFWLAGEGIVRAVGLPLPGAIIGMALTLAALCWGGLDIGTVKRGADWFMAEMLLFFIPAVLAVLDHHEFLGPLGVKLFAVIFVSTAAVMYVTALTVDLCLRWRERHELASLVE
ncbi:MAG: CidA/LrgA family protein [Xanthobacteraceae bacterium]|nr:CidA/LrgA family protein [Xanthobacteraceae bacterium]MBV9632149.1 CidA/LrgA family protein [Xanthobacteraceae bacterium]